MTPRVLLLTIVALAGAAACDGRQGFERSPPGVGAGGSQGFDPGVGGGCADGPCGNEVHDLVFDVPNVYLVFDRSGSMGTPVGDESRYDVVRDAAIDMVDTLGSLINVGAAVFPHGDLQASPCAAGTEVFAMSPGGTKTRAFREAIDLPTVGGTPIAATLDALRPKLAALTGRTVVLLLTDGSPNCNALASCDADACTLNIEGFCDPSENCCAPDVPGGPLNCVDRQATVTAVASIRALGIDVYVIGIPGSEVYGDVLDEMALAGGTAVGGQHHQVDDLDALASLFKRIAADNISCRIDLSDPPAMDGFTNVYFDCRTVPYDPVDGWAWYEGHSIFLHGDACAELKRGDVRQVKVATGCPTELPK